MKDIRGQTFVEVVVVVSIVVIVVTALVSGSIASLRVIGYNSSKSQATKYAQEGLELARKERDSSWNVFYNKSVPSPQVWCIDKIGTWTQQSVCPVNIDGIFTRVMRLSYDSANQRIDATATVSWNDGGNIRMSKIETFFTQWR